MDIKDNKRSISLETFCLMQAQYVGYSATRAFKNTKEILISSGVTHIKFTEGEIALVDYNPIAKEKE